MYSLATSVYISYLLRFSLANTRASHTHAVYRRLYSVVFFLNHPMAFWYEFTCEFVTIDYGRYEAVRDLGKSTWNARFTWTPVLAGPQPA